ncbi:cupin domain-containing protein [Sphingomonas oligoaromativorans]|uniref:cupin domain-containing protein n=1 Tax=Sphingomonas oligoaromativorans TaxID=575322 RepID=UPI00141E5DA8|nr:cupin domain-containing protein [Sphingomonas oligoaromativorans]NIJ32300.1 quercetin dioxygenase-like cupin family protein [Sphingomonas oligoaromativorans]
MRLTVTGAMLTATAALICCSAMAWAQERKAILGPAVFDWNAMTAVRNGTGEVRSIVKQPTATLDELEMHVTTLNPGVASHPPHRHPNEELVIIDRGTVETLSNGQWKRVGPGSVIFNASNSLHALRNVGSTPAQYHVINWKSATTPAH